MLVLFIVTGRVALSFIGQMKQLVRKSWTGKFEKKINSEVKNYK